MQYFLFKILKTKRKCQFEDLTTEAFWIRFNSEIAVVKRVQVKGHSALQLAHEPWAVLRKHGDVMKRFIAAQTVWLATRLHGRKYSGPEVVPQRQRLLFSNNNASDMNNKFVRQTWNKEAWFHLWIKTFCTWTTGSDAWTGITSSSFLSKDHVHFIWDIWPCSCPVSSSLPVEAGWTSGFPCIPACEKNLGLKNVIQ